MRKRIILYDVYINIVYYIENVIHVRLNKISAKKEEKKEKKVCSSLKLGEKIK